MKMRTDMTRMKIWIDEVLLGMIILSNGTVGRAFAA